ncbi:MAG: hypothetical protein WCO92_02795, partial [Verrucomicrobiota bacterium]
MVGREQLAVQKRTLAARWHHLAAETAKSVNGISQQGMIIPPGEFLDQDEAALRDALIAHEAQLEHFQKSYSRTLRRHSGAR